MTRTLTIDSTLTDLVKSQPYEWADADSIKVDEVSRIIHMVGAGLINKVIHYKFLGTHKTVNDMELCAILLGAVLVHAKVHRRHLGDSVHKKMMLGDCKNILSTPVTPNVLPLAIAMLVQFVEMNHQPSAPQLKSALSIIHCVGVLSDEKADEFLDYFEGHDISVHFLPF